eukprot:Sspe_Gene.68029::Locus_40135_Transcript_1_1_Confidence_1.000_Length_1503::g.68029::m.68029
MMPELRRHEFKDNTAVLFLKSRDWLRTGWKRRQVQIHQTSGGYQFVVLKLEDGVLRPCKKHCVALPLIKLIRPYTLGQDEAVMVRDEEGQLESRYGTIGFSITHSKNSTLTFAADSSEAADEWMEWLYTFREHMGLVEALNLVTSPRTTLPVGRRASALSAHSSENGKVHTMVIEDYSPSTNAYDSSSMESPRLDDNQGSLRSQSCRAGYPRSYSHPPGVSDEPIPAHRQGSKVTTPILRLAQHSADDSNSCSTFSACSPNHSLCGVPGSPGAMSPVTTPTNKRAAQHRSWCAPTDASPPPATFVISHPAPSSTPFLETTAIPLTQQGSTLRGNSEGFLSAPSSPEKIGLLAHAGSSETLCSLSSLRTTSGSPLSPQGGNRLPIPVPLSRGTPSPPPCPGASPPTLTVTGSLLGQGHLPLGRGLLPKKGSPSIGVKSSASSVCSSPSHSPSIKVLTPLTDL